MQEPVFQELAPYRGYTDGLARGALTYQHCEACLNAVFYPRVSCPHCGATCLQWRDSSGQGTVYSVTQVAAKDGSYNVVLVDMDEGFRMMSTVVNQSTPAIGQRVLAHVQEVPGDTTRVVFEVQA